VFLNITNLSSRASFLMRAPLTVPVLHAVAGAFIDNDEYTSFQEALQATFPYSCFSSYCVDHLPGSAALITFSRLISPLVYTYKNKPVRMRAPDASEFSLFVQEVPLRKAPSSFTSNRKGYIS
jgi:hypothetical protein